MERITLEEKVTKIVMKIGRPRALAFLRSEFGVANFSKLDNASLARFIEYFKEHA